MNKVIITKKNKTLLSALESKGFELIKLSDDNRLPKFVSHHTDLQLFVLDKEAKRGVVLKNSPSIELLERENWSIYETKLHPENKYPLDCLCNGIIIKNHLFCNEKIIDSVILEKCHEMGYKICHVPQGYTACSICKLNDNAIITADEKIALAAKKLSIDVLKINEDNIVLDGYDYGFIGGCYGVSRNKIYFTGNLNHLKNGDNIRKFIKNHNFEIVELSNSQLVDIGGIIFI